MRHDGLKHQVSCVPPEYRPPTVGIYMFIDKPENLSLCEALYLLAVYTRLSYLSILIDCMETCKLIPHSMRMYI